MGQQTMTVRTAEILGTEQYTAPEYFLGEGGTPRSDQFSLGVITYQMLSGGLPYGADATPGLYGVLWTNTQLNVGGSPYAVAGDLTVAPGVTVTQRVDTAIQTANLRWGAEVRVETAVEGQPPASGSTQPIIAM